MHNHTLLLALLMSTLAACAAPSYVTKHGLRVYDKTELAISAASVEDVTEKILQTIGHPERLDGVSVFLVPTIIEIPQQNGKISRTDGYTNPFDLELMASVFSTCLYASGLVHELAHIIHDRPLPAPDWWHEDQSYWEQVKAMEASLRQQCTPEELRQEAEARGKKPEDALPPGTRDPAPPTDEQAEAAKKDDPAPDAEAPSEAPQPTGTVDADAPAKSPESSPATGE